MAQEIITIRDPEQLIAEGFKLQPRVTLEDSEDYKKWRAELDKWITRLPGLRTPRNADGTGGTPPREHQLRHAAIALQRRHYFASWTMGVGKTGMSILCMLGWFGHQLFKNTNWNSSNPFERPSEFNLPPGSIHIVAPKHTLNQVWMRELERMNMAQFAEVITSESGFYNAKSPIFIYHYDLLKQQTSKGNFLKKLGGDHGCRIKDGGKTYFVGEPLAKLVAKRCPPSLLIVDEIHRLREGSERTRVMQMIRRKARRVIGLTGTPMDGWVHQMATVLGYIYGENTHAYPFTNNDFARKFTRTKVVTTSIVDGKEEAGKERPVPGINHLQIPNFLHSTQHLMHRLNLSDAEVKANVIYPPVVSHKVKVDMDLKHYVFYTSLHRNTKQDASKALITSANKAKLRQNMLTLMNGLRQGSSAPWGLGFCGNTNLVNTVVDIVKAHKLEKRKGLIGTTFIEESRAIHEALKKAGLNGVRLYAADPKSSLKTMTSDKREELLEQFMEDPDCVYLIANKELVAEGLNLAETASYSISCSHGYRANIEAQWLARIVRPGQSWSHVDAYTLLNEGTIDIYIYELLQSKLAATAGLIDLDFSVSVEDLSNAIDPVLLAEMLTKDVLV